MTKTEKFYEVCNKAKSSFYIFDYYPFGSKTEWEYWLCGKVNLKKVYLDKRYKNLTEKDLILKILNEVGRAMHYTIVWYGPEHKNEYPDKKDWFLSQRIEAFNMWHLFTCGKMGWNKKLTKNKTEKEIEDLEKFHSKRSNIVYDRDEEEQIFKNKKEKAEYIESKNNLKLYNRKKHGIYEVEHMPLMQNYTMKPLYNKQQLCAIWLMVQCAFENMC